MKTVVSIGVALAGSLIALRCLPPGLRERVTCSVKRRVSGSFEHMMAGLLESSRPKLIMSVLPKLQVQNDQIISELQELNEHVREQPLLH